MQDTTPYPDQGQKSQQELQTQAYRAIDQRSNLFQRRVSLYSKCYTRRRSTPDTPSNPDPDSPRTYTALVYTPSQAPHRTASHHTTSPDYPSRLPRPPTTSLNMNRHPPHPTHPGPVLPHPLQRIRHIQPLPQHIARHHENRYADDQPCPAPTQRFEVAVALEFGVGHLGGFPGREGRVGGWRWRGGGGK